jgi:hypothetical protein
MPAHRPWPKLPTRPSYFVYPYTIPSSLVDASSSDMPTTRGSSKNRSTAVCRRLGGRHCPPPRDPLGRGVIVLTESHHHLSVPRSGLHHAGIKSLDGSPPRMRHKQKNSFHAESRARSNSFERSPPRPTTSHQRDSSLKRMILSTNSLDSFEGRPSTAGEFTGREITGMVRC